VSATAHDRAAPPSVPRQILRAAAGTFAVLLAVGLVTGAVLNVGRVQGLWYRLVGDPNIALAPGVTLSATPQTVSVPTLVSAPWAPRTEVARIVAVTGAPVRAVSAEMAARLTGTATPDTGSFSTHERYYTTPMGVVEVMDAQSDLTTIGGHVATVSLVGTAASPAGRTAAARRTFLQRLLDAWGAGSMPLPSGARAVAMSWSGAAGDVEAHLTNGVVQTADCGIGIAFFDPVTGKLLRATVALVRAGTPGTAHVVGAATAFDHLRHQGDASGAQVTVSSARLVTYDDADSTTPPEPGWVFFDAHGGMVADAPSS
jgi:hypothetical protein